MYKIINDKGSLFTEYQYVDEAENEKMIVANAKSSLVHRASILI